VTVVRVIGSVQEISTGDLQNMGLGIDSFTIRQVPPVIESLTGLKLEQLLERLRPKPTDGNPAPESPQVKP
jgi:hypothetical protein